MTTMQGCIASPEMYTVAKELRQELKQWEQSFAAAHQGRKVEREDIKQRPDIAHKYKQYERLRRPASKPLNSYNATPSKNRSATDPYPVSSSLSSYKRPKHAHPARHLGAHSSDSEPPQQLSPRALRTSIGPTPQKDGQVLGLFDQIPTFSNSQTLSKRKALHSVEANVQATPSKRPHSKKATEEGKKRQKSLSSSNGKPVNYPLTPATRRTTDLSTPSSRGAASNLQFDDTPAFLRRDSQRADEINEIVLRDEGVSWSPVALRKLPKAAGQGLSAIMRGFRDMEDEGMDEELNILRGLEHESVPENRWDQPRDVVSESQRPDMPLGPDRGRENEEDSLEDFDDEKGENGKSVRVWKKRGQKRTTRRALMLPNIARRKPKPAWKVDKAIGNKEDCPTAVQNSSTSRVIDYGCDSGGHEVEDVIGSERTARARNRKKNALENALEHKKGWGKKMKKISATAHANFRALKIKNRQSKMKKCSISRQNR